MHIRDLTLAYKLPSCNRCLTFTDRFPQQPWNNFYTSLPFSYLEIIVKGREFWETGPWFEPLWDIYYLGPSVEVSWCVHEVCVMFLMCAITQLALVFTVVVCSGFEVNTDTVGFLIAMPFTVVYAWDLESPYVMVRQTFASEVVRRWKRHLTTSTWCKEIELLEWAEMTFIAWS